MAYTTINKSGDYFNTKLYTGNGGTQSITGVGFQPDWVWLKSRSVADSPILFDVVRGVTKRLMTNSTGGETTEAQEVQSFNSDGFTVGNSDNANRNNATMVGWNWKAGGAGSANTAGTINSTVSANTTAGFSIVKYTGNGSSGATVGHGLTTTAPKIVLIKTTSGADAWTMLNTNIDLNKYLALNSTSAEISDPMFNNTAPTTTHFTLDADGQVNGSGVSLIAYCFSEVTGYSKFGSYTGNGNADGTFVFCGFKPAWVMVKNANNASADWTMFDVKRDTYNIMDKRLRANLGNAEDAPLGFIDFTSNGFKWRTDSFAVNGSGNTHIYMAFAEAPLVGSNNVPCTAR